jgi:ribonuclease R
VAAITISERLDSHKLIEEFMISANVAAAKTLEKANIPCLYRIHDEPSQEKLNNLREVLNGINISFEKGGVASPKRFNQVLKLAKGSLHAEMINVMVLRS